MPHLLNSDLYLKYKSIGFNAETQEELIEALEKVVGVKFFHSLTADRSCFIAGFTLQKTSPITETAATLKKAQDKALHKLFDYLYSYI